MHTVIAALLFLGVALAQREDGQFWPCNPIINATGACNPDPGLPTSTYTVDFTKETTILQNWTISNYATVNFGELGAEFTYNQRYDSPQLWTDFFILFGRVEVEMRVANGTGMISSAVLISDDFDEIDFEFSGNNFGISAYAAGQGQNNYFGKGITGNYDRGSFFDVKDPQGTFHTYAVDWSPERLLWEVDGVVVRTLEYSDTTTASGSAYQYPQTPSKFQLGIWAGGDPGQNTGTMEWAGGMTNVTGGPYTMFVRKVTIQNAMPASAYNWTDQSGPWQSIQLLQESVESGPSPEITLPSMSMNSTDPSQGVSSPGGSTATSGDSTTTIRSTRTSIIQSTTTVPPTTGGDSTTTIRSTRTSVIRSTTTVPHATNPGGAGVPAGTSSGATTTRSTNLGMIGLSKTQPTQQSATTSTSTTRPIAETSVDAGTGAGTSQGETTPIADSNGNPVPVPPATSTPVFIDPIPGTSVDAGASTGTSEGETASPVGSTDQPASILPTSATVFTDPIVGTSVDAGTSTGETTPIVGTSQPASATPTNLTTTPGGDTDPDTAVEPAQAPSVTTQGQSEPTPADTPGATDPADVTGTEGPATHQGGAAGVRPPFDGRWLVGSLVGFWMQRAIMGGR